MIFQSHLINTYIRDKLANSRTKSFVQGFD